MIAMEYEEFNIKETIEINRLGDTFLVDKLMEPLDRVCANLQGCLLDANNWNSQDMKESIFRTSQYLVASSVVVHEVNILKGNRRTRVTYRNDQKDSALLERISAIYTADAQTTYKSRLVEEKPL